MKQSQPTGLGQHYLESARREFQRLKLLAEKSFDQISSPSHFHVTLEGQSNSVATLIRHLAGNMTSRWTDFLTTDGEKPDRNRDAEFEPKLNDVHEALIAAWNRGWQRLFQTMKNLGPEDLLKTVHIRGEQHTVVEAIHRQLTHTAYHVGQIVYLLKHLESSRWESLSIPRGRSADHYRKGDYLREDGDDPGA